MVKLDRINLSNEGLTKFFSPIEAQIMEVLWTTEESTTPEISEKKQEFRYPVWQGRLTGL
ncbi:hypothetical protein [Methanosarcina horonobensis]|uniref:hypothetical protein n=1 Tax=Methanosarcina horonobensis TaxID=418008 RepID=UPI0022B8D1BD|nr:hypothetical protein [Methanosarcina horonobensis]